MLLKMLQVACENQIYKENEVVEEDDEDDEEVEDLNGQSVSEVGSI